MSLNQNPDKDSVELVKYVPQSYLEEICNEVDLSASSQFRDELESVIFSHVPEADRLGFSSLRELLDHKRRETDERLQILYSEMSSINLEIAGVEARITPANRTQLANRLAEAKRDLEAHDAIRPQTIPEPKEPTEDEIMVDVLRQMAEKDDLAQKLRAQIESNRSALNNVARELDSVRRVEEQLGNLGHQVALTKERVSAELEQIGVAIDDILVFRVDTKPLEAARKVREELRRTLQISFSEDHAESLVNSLQQVAFSQEQLQQSLQGPQLAYRQYLADLEEWNLRRAAIVGGPDVEGTVLYFENQLKMLESLPKQLEEAKSRRRIKIREIHGQLRDLCSTYESLYQPVQTFALQHPLLGDRFRPEFSVNILQRRLSEEFFTHINRARAGSFCGQANGDEVLSDLIDTTDFQDENSVVQFVESVVDRLHADFRVADRPSTMVADQLRAGSNPHAVYDLISCLKYLAPEYSLRLQGKGLSELSPGERGTLLLMFYLLVDLSDKPLLIDQPEENLDNQTVFSLVGECIKEAKKRRQVIIVTHNPNLAVACDAEQIICASRDVDARNSIRYVSGAIENPEINRRILDVLEGTLPAFDSRDSKYQR